MSTLDATDLRSRLYRHMLDPRIPDRTDPAHDAVNRHDLRRPFESITQQRIFRELRDRGYEVIAQYQLGNRRIDLLIVGDQGRLAVECDGPSVHRTPDELAAEIAHDRELRRCDWRIVRIRESEFVLDPQAALAPLWGAAPATRNPPTQRRPGSQHMTQVGNRPLGQQLANAVAQLWNGGGGPPHSAIDASLWYRPRPFHRVQQGTQGPRGPGYSR